MRTHKFFDPELDRLAAIAAEIEAEMLYASTTAENAVLSALTAAGYADFLSIHTSTGPATTGANEITAGGTASITATAYSAGVITFTASNSLAVGQSVSFSGLTGTGWTGLNVSATGGVAYIVTSATSTQFTIAFASFTGTGSTTGTVYVGYNRVGITWGTPASGSVANTNTLVSNIPGSTTITYFGTFAQITGTGGNGYVFGGTLSSITFPSAGTVTVAIGGLVESAS